MTEAYYLAMNSSEEPIAGRAIYNVTPPEASLYFVKTECFCFTEQVLQANESREMPVYYFIQPDLPDHIKEITLSYTFFRDENPSAEALADHGESGPVEIIGDR
jgi:cytochrome c oxidase assembly protein subunit 11